jgi:hypothetical protein
MGLSINPAVQSGAGFRADRGILRRFGNPFDLFRGIAVKYAQELLASFATPACMKKPLDFDVASNPVWLSPGLFRYSVPAVQMDTDQLI